MTISQSDLSNAERALTEVWGGPVRLDPRPRDWEHPHVTRLAVSQAPPGAPVTVIHKRARREGEPAYDTELSVGHLYNDWAALSLLRDILGDETPAPKVHGGDAAQGFFIMEDMVGQDPLGHALNGDDAAGATAALGRYSVMLARLHASTLGQADAYRNRRAELGVGHPPEVHDFTVFFGAAVRALECLDIDLTSAARADVQEAAETLNEPGTFSAFTHGDAVFPNTFLARDRWCLIDFENARFRHALWEGSYPRMLFPTSGLDAVRSLPEAAWRAAEAAYRRHLAAHLPAAADNDLYGAGMTAACACWALALCLGHLSIETAFTSDAPWVDRLRRPIVARLEQFVLTTQEFGRLEALGETFSGLLDQARREWPVEHTELVLYQAYPS